MTKDGRYARITVLMISYKQENLIGRALDSILRQREYGLKDIVISDDCSPDNTWGVIEKYKKEYPDFINAHRNDVNLGITPNLERAKSYVLDTDYIIHCSGDDAIEDGYFKAFQELLNVEEIKPQDESVAVYGDFKMVFPNGKEIVFHQTLYKKGYSSSDLHIKGLLLNRSSFVTYALFKRYKPLDTTSIGRGEFSQEIQQHMLAKRRYYVPAIGNIYYAKIGVSTQMYSYKSLQERIEETQWIIDTFPMNNDCKHRLKSRIYDYRYSQKKTFGDFFKYWFHYFMSKPVLSLKSIARTSYYMIFK